MDNPKEITGLKEWRNTRNGFYVVRAHYTADPKKRSDEWRALEKQGIPTNDWNREYEIDFSSFSGKPVFLHDYNDARMAVPFETSSKFPILRSWDFGYHHPAVSWGQFIDGVQLVILQSDLGEDVDFRIYARHILHLSSIFFPGREFLDCCDQAGVQVHSTGDKEIYILANEFGIIPRHKYLKVDYTIDILRKLMNSTYRHLPCFIINPVPSNALLRDALRGGYHYAEKTEGRAEKEEPFQDGYYENVVDPVRYMAANFMGLSEDVNRDMLRMASSGIIPERKAL